jgi:hypothetical protein
VVKKGEQNLTMIFIGMTYLLKVPTGFGLESLRNVLRSPPDKSSRTMNLGCFSKQTPMK